MGSVGRTGPAAPARARAEGDDVMRLPRVLRYALTGGLAAVVDIAAVAAAVAVATVAAAAAAVVAWAAAVAAGNSPSDRPLATVE